MALPSPGIWLIPYHFQPSLGRDATMNCLSTATNKNPGQGRPRKEGDEAYKGDRWRGEVGGRGKIPSSGTPRTSMTRLSSPWMTSNLVSVSQCTAPRRRSLRHPVSASGSTRMTSLTSNSFSGSGAPLLAARVFSRATGHSRSVCLSFAARHQYGHLMDALSIPDATRIGSAHESA